MHKYLVSACLAAVTIAAPAHAQLAVIDKAALAKAIDAAKNSLDAIGKAQEQIQQNAELFGSLNGTTDIKSVGQILDRDALRGGLPEDVTDFQAYMSDNLSDLGAIGDRAKQIADGSNFSMGGSGSIDDAIELLGKRASRDQALAEYALENTSDRAKGLGELNERLGRATSQRELSEFSARAGLETAAAVNEANRMTALQAAHEAEANRLAVEQNAAWRADSERRADEINETIRKAAREALAGKGK